MNKKEFKKKCKQEKTASYQLMRLGGILSIIGLIIVMLSFLIMKEYIPQIVGLVIGGIIGLIGMILDLIGEITLTKKYKEYNLLKHKDFSDKILTSLCFFIIILL